MKKEANRKMQGAMSKIKLRMKMLKEGNEHIEEDNSAANKIDR